MPQQQLDELLAEEEDSGEDLFEVWSENWHVVHHFLACRNQWIVGAMGGLLGLRAEGVKAIFEMRCVKRTDQGRLFDDLQSMGQAAAAVLNRKD